MVLLAVALVSAAYLSTRPPTPQAALSHYLESWQLSRKADPRIAFLVEDANRKNVLVSHKIGPAAKVGESWEFQVVLTFQTVTKSALTHSAIYRLSPDESGPGWAIFARNP